MRMHRFQHRSRGGATVRVGGCAGAVFAIGILAFTLVMVGGALACAGAGGFGHAHYGHHG
jgi:hypothetical protein